MQTLRNRKVGKKKGGRIANVWEKRGKTFASIPLAVWEVFSRDQMGEGSKSL